MAIRPTRATLLGMGREFASGGSGSGSALGTYASVGGGTAAVLLGGYLYENDATIFVRDYDYVEIGGLHFACKAYASHNNSSRIGSVSATGLTATSTQTTILGNYTANAKINSLDFYTYT